MNLIDPLHVQKVDHYLILWPLTPPIIVMANLKIELSKLKSEAWPGALEIEKEKWMLINEKEELLKELQFVTSCKRTQDELKHLEAERKRLEEELSMKSTSSDELTERSVTFYLPCPFCTLIMFLQDTSWVFAFCL
uniref:WWC1-like helical hairpin domain-containing protein n=1 Tax=Laticauda laticaudata TaxID=8630 RepID=A0A8C5RLV0_LATLA